MEAETRLRPLSESVLRAMSEEDFEAYEAALEEAYWARGRDKFLDFCTMVDVPGAPIRAEEDDKFFQDKVVPAAHHTLIIDAVQKLADGAYHDIDGIMCFMPPGSAKALALDTPIPTPGGWRRMGDLQVGDKVFDENGKPCDVTWVSPIWRNRPVYRVVTDCGDEIIADRDHEWLVRLDGKPRKPLKGGGWGRPGLANRDDPMSKHKIKETWELERRRTKRPMIKRAGALDLPPVDLPVDPYFLGIWLGDGHSNGMRITSSVWDQPWLRGELERLGFKTKASRTVETEFAVHGVRDKFVSLGLINDPWHATHGKKYIPQIYMRASAEQRLALVQGLVDTDGTVCKRRGCATFCSTNKHLAEQFRELVRSLGVKAGWSESPAMLKGKFCGMAYKVSFYHAQAARMPRKAKLCRDQYRTPDTYIDVTACGVTDTVCIEVNSPSHLFLCGRSMTPTHNSTYTSVLAPAWLLGRKPGTNVIATSYGDDLAQKFGRRVRTICKSNDFQKIMGCSVSGDNAAVNDWSLTTDSTYRASGLGGTITGIRADYMFIDDPVKNREEADSELIREKRWEAYLDDVQSRLKPGGKIFIIMTRWHEDDLCGRLLGETWKGQSGLWRTTDGRLYLVINLPLLAEHKDDPLGRTPGELLWPEWFRMSDAKRLQEGAKKGGAQARTWSSLYQQRPKPNEGAILARHYWREWKHKQLPEVEQVFLCYDTAFEEGEENDYSAMSAWGVFEHVSKKPTGEEYKHKHVILLGYWQDKVSAVDLMDVIVHGYTGEDGTRRPSHVALFKPDRILVEKRASGIQLIQEMKRKRIPVVAWLPKGKPGSKGKLPRAHAIAVILEQGSVWYVPGPKTDLLLDQCAAFPYGTNDDGCLVAGTLIALRRGLTPIEQVVVGDEVLTPQGWRRVAAAGRTGIKPVVARGPLVGTGNHPVFDLDKGYVSLESVDTVTMARTVARATLWSLTKTIRRKPWNFSAHDTALWADAKNTTCLRQGAGQSARAPKASTWPSGSTTMGALCRKATRSTIKTATLLTAALRIWIAYRGLSIKHCLGSGWTRMRSVLTWSARARLRQRGISQTRAASGTGRMPSGQASFSQGPSVTLSDPSLQPHVRSAAPSSSASTFEKLSAPSDVTTKSAAVYNLSVEGAQCYYANGVLVHNCDTVTMALAYFRDKFIFQTHEDELDNAELKEELLARSDARRSGRALYGSRPTGSLVNADYDADDIERMTPETRRKLWGSG